MVVAHYMFLTACILGVFLKEEEEKEGQEGVASSGSLSTGAQPGDVQAATAKSPPIAFLGKTSLADGESEKDASAWAGKDDEPEGQRTDEEKKLSMEQSGCVDTIEEGLAELEERKHAEQNRKYELVEFDVRGETYDPAGDADDTHTHTDTVQRSHTVHDWLALKHVDLDVRRVHLAARLPYLVLLCIGVVFGVTGLIYSLGEQTDEFTSFAESELLQIFDTCALTRGTSAGGGANCDTVYTSFKYASPLLRELPSYIRANAISMTVAYSFLGASSPLGNYLFLKALTVHRSLGLCNAMRLEGYNDAVRNEACWLYYSIFKHSEPYMLLRGKARTSSSVCDVIDSEFDDLKALYTTTFGRSEISKLHSQTKTMWQFCTTMNYFVKNDWEHHRMEVLGGHLNGTWASAFVDYTYWHWMSFFDQHKTHSQMRRSFWRLAQRANVSLPDRSSVNVGAE
eukprot:TRINITY_DN3653_c1_g2_i1.p1 TRINITY_DN3653_c1_g2~~TRINITY_DN3653_c1_g2_i1.p1  ORF type:complete len:494 (+),score=67.36 TRINITY_DN3653_c1_g2_i1:119-1483(+)